MARRRDLDRLQGEIEELFSDLWQVPSFAGMRHGFRPSVDCFRTDDPPELTVVVELPGVDPASVDLVAVERTLIISGDRARPDGKPGQVYQQVEIEYGPFERTLALGADVDTAGARASYEHGLLTIVLPIAKRPTGRVKIALEIDG